MNNVGRVMTPLSAMVILLTSASASFAGQRRDPVSVSPSQEVALGNVALKKFLEGRPSISDSNLIVRVDTIGRRIADVSDRPDHHYRFMVLQGDEIQAYAFPGGTICVPEGLVRLFPVDDELAFVLGHELSHIVLRHKIADLRLDVEIANQKARSRTLLRAVQERFDRVRSSGKGFIIVSAHMGNWEWSAALIPAMGLDTMASSKPQHNPLVERVLRSRRMRFGLKLAWTRKSPRKLIEHLKSGGVVGILGDQDARHRGIFVRFFGREASTAGGPAWLARRRGPGRPVPAKHEVRRRIQREIWSRVWSMVYNSG